MTSLEAGIMYSHVFVFDFFFSSPELLLISLFASISVIMIMTQPGPTGEAPSLSYQLAIAA